MSKNDGGPAFPETKYGGNSNRHPVDEVPGMTLRDYFAGQALASLEYSPSDSTKDAATDAILVMARRAYRIADAMLTERSK